MPLQSDEPDLSNAFWTKVVYKEFGDLKDNSRCGLLCSLDSKPCNVFLVHKGNCYLGSVTSQNAGNSEGNKIIFEENSKNAKVIAEQLEFVLFS